MLLPIPKFRLSSVMMLCLLFAVALTYGCKSTPRKPLIEATLGTIPQQEFTIDASKNEVVVGAAGSVFAIPKGAFLDAKGKKVIGEVKIVIQEAPDLATMFRAGMQTVSKDGLLRTDGSYSIEAFKHDEAVTLDPKVGIFAYFPTDKVDPDMNLYNGRLVAENVEWTLTTTPQAGIPVCDTDQETRKKCKKCEQLVKMNQSIHPGQMPLEADDFWSKRYYWHDGVMYFAASGSARPVFKKKDLQDCQDYMSRTKDGLELLAKVKQITETQLSNIGNHYAFRLNSLGWKNCDALVKEDLVAFSGKVVDDDGKAVGAAMVHLYCKERNIHVMTQTDFDGSYSFSFQPQTPFTLYAYQGDKVGKSNLSIRSANESVSSVQVNKISENEVEKYLEDLI
ncbi:MAG: carboxypeptidase regulatory-like domain-containing protein [Bacteroidia bacterium]|nr:carboxypeptidase regulatory-like domain-containing protein [Bacteroidia bacterium]